LGSEARQKDAGASPLPFALPHPREYLRQLAAVFRSSRVYQDAGSDPATDPL